MLLVFFTNSLALIETNMSEYFDKTYNLVSLFPIKGLCGSKTPSNFTKACSNRRFVIKTLPRTMMEAFCKKKLTILTQLTFACSKSTIETLEKGVKYAYFTPFSSLSIAEFERENVNWKLFLYKSFIIDVQQSSK